MVAAIRALNKYTRGGKRVLATTRIPKLGRCPLRRRIKMEWLLIFLFVSAPNSSMSTVAAFSSQEECAAAGQ